MHFIFLPYLMLSIIGFDIVLSADQAQNVKVWPWGQKVVQEFPQEDSRSCFAKESLNKGKGLLI